MAKQTKAAPATCGADTFQVVFKIGSELPGETGKPVYASASVNAIGTGTDLPAGFLTWDKYSEGTSVYPATLQQVNSLTPIITKLTSVTGSVSATIAATYPVVANTIITQSIPTVITTTITGYYGSATTTFTVENAAGIETGMVPFGGMPGGGNGFGALTVIAVSGNTVTVSANTLVTLSEGATVTFTGSTTSITIQVQSTDNIVAGMVPFGGMTNALGSGFAGDTTVHTVSGNTVTLSQPTVANVIAAGAAVSFTPPFTTGTTTITVNDATNVAKGMVPRGGMPDNGEAFSGDTVVTAVNLATNIITLSEATINTVSSGAPVTFWPGMVTEIVVDSVSNIEAGMSVSGGTSSATGDGFNSNAFVLLVDSSANTVTLSDSTPFTNLFFGGTVSFTPPVPSQQIGTIGTASSMTLCIPATQVLSGARIIFSLEHPGNFPFNAAGQPIVPVPYKGNVKEAYYDFIEFAWTFPTAGTTNLNYDTSIVDQFGLPVTIQFGGQPQTKRGVPIDRETVFTNYASQVPAAVAAGMLSTNSDPGPAQVAAFFSSLSTVMAPYRILAPADAFLLAQEQGATPAFQQTVNAVSTYFDALITAFFNAYDPTINANAGFVMQNVAGSQNTGKAGSGAHDLTGTVIAIQQTGTDGNTHSYRVLQLTDNTPGITADNGSGWVYNIYEPFFSSNGYPTMPPPPYWLTSGKTAPTTESPSLMVFGASGVFADSDIKGAAQPTPSDAGMVPYQTLLGAIENQLVTAISRGIVLAPQWRWLYQSPGNSAVLSPQVTVNTGKTLTLAAGAYVPVYIGMSVMQTSGTQAIGQGSSASPNIVTDVSMDDSGNTTVTLSMANKVTANTDNVNVSFSYANIANPFYQLSDPMSAEPFNSITFNNNGTWNYFAWFFHQPFESATQTGVSIDGLAYAYAFDDQGNFSTDISLDMPASAIVNIGTTTRSVIGQKAF